MNLKEHTILLLCGPSGCGKTTFAKELLKQIPDAVYISSDDCRREFGGQIHEMNPLIMRYSVQAFSLLEQKIDLHSQYPVNSPLIIVDSTGLSSSFRNKIQNIARNNNYYCDVVLFAYDKREDYLQLAKDTAITAKHITKFFEEIGKMSGFNQKHKITKFNNWPTVLLERHTNYVEGKSLIVGDVHGCYDELVNLEKSVPEYDNLILVGDLIDKGPHSEKVLDFVLEKNAHVVIGNHENFVYKYRAGLITADNEAMNYFDSINLGDSFHQKLEQVYKDAHPFLIGDNFIVTHAPCHKNQLGKTGENSIKAQRNFRHSHLTHDQLREELSFLSTEDQYNYPYHIFGHIAMTTVCNGKSYLGIDTNAVGGGRLTAVLMNGFSKPFYYSVPSNKYVESDSFNLHLQTKTLNDLEFAKDIRLAHECAEHKVNFISGTMCPADRG